MIASFRGGCHCGAITIAFESSVPIADLVPRACQCTFCRKHAQVSVSDPRGFLRITADAGRLGRYQFGLRTCDMLICTQCGVYVAAYMASPPRAVVNLNTLDGAPPLSPPRPVDYDGETETMRLARRADRWTPAELLLR